MSKTSKLRTMRKQLEELKRESAQLRANESLVNTMRYKYNEVQQLIAEVCHETHPLHQRFIESYRAISGHDLDFVRSTGYAVSNKKMLACVYQDSSLMTLPVAGAFAIARVHPLILSYYKLTEDSHQVMLKLRYQDEMAVIAVNEQAFANIGVSYLTYKIANQLVRHLKNGFKPSTTEKKVL